MLSITSSAGIRQLCPASAMSALASAFTLWLALRKEQGSCTSPATGSQIRPMQLISAMAQASAQALALPPAICTAPAAAIAAAVPHSA